MTKEGYQPIKTKKTIKIIPPNTSSNVQKKDGYTWEDLDKAWWEGFDNAKNKMEKRITELEKEAEEWVKDHSGLTGSYMFVKYDYDSMQKSYFAGAEPREKRIAELEAQIEKMKCCQNCRKFNNLSYDCTCAEVCNEWELRR